MYQQQHEKFLTLYQSPKRWVIAERFATDLRDGWPEMADLLRYYAGENSMTTNTNPRRRMDWDGVHRATSK